MIDIRIYRKFATLGELRLLKGIVFPTLMAGVPLTVAIVAGLAHDDGGGGLVVVVERFSSISSSLVRDIGLALGFGISFAAGMVATVNPCGFPMLPAYLAMYLGSDDNNTVNSSMWNRLGRASLVSGVVTSGFVLVFGTVGLVVGGGVGLVVDAMPWVGLGIGVLLALTGGWMFGGGVLYSSRLTGVANHMKNPARANVRGFFLFGLGYATASLSCTLPIFLAVTGISLVSDGFISAVGKFFIYGLGMGLVIIILTLCISLFEGAMIGKLRQFVLYVKPISAGFMTLSGAYIVFYWLTIGGLMR